MRNVSHKSWVKIISEAVEQWRVQRTWSREKVCAQFVEEFEHSEDPHAWNIEFSHHPDVFQRQKNDADKIMRWLDNDSKDTNLLGLNFSRVILRRLPAGLRMACLNEMLAPLELTVRGSEQCDSQDLNATSHLVKLAREASEAQAAIADLIDNPNPANLAKTERELADVEEAARAARVDVHQQINLRSVA
jgi:hypothetical protein